MASGTALGHGLPAPGVGEEHLCSPLHTRPLSVLFGNDRPTAIRANPPLALHVKLRPATREGSGYPGNRVVRGLALPDGLDGLLAPFAVHAALDSHRPSVLLPSPQMLRRTPVQKTAPLTAVNGVTGGGPCKQSIWGYSVRLPAPNLSGMTGKRDRRREIRRPWRPLVGQDP